MRPGTFGLLLPLLAILMGCAGPVVQATPEEFERAFPLIVDGETSKSELARRGFGAPDQEFEHGRIQAYSVWQDEFGEWRIDRSGKRSKSSPYDLILVFTPDGIVERHGLVLTRKNP